MSGIVGALALNAQADPHLCATRMVRALAHRGLDGTYVTVQSPCALGLCRTDTSAVPTSVTYPEHKDGIWIVADARIDNREELTRDLELQTTISEGLIIIHAYMRWGEGFIRHLRGDFAFLIWDSNRQEALAARDPIGVKPLYYSKWNGVLLFASEMQALFASTPDTKKIPNQRSLLLYLIGEYGEDNETLYEGVYCLPAGHKLVATRFGNAHSAYYDFLSVPTIRYRDPRDYQSHYRDLFRSAVKSRLVTHQSAVLELSGGIDSSSIVAQAVELQKNGQSFAAQKYIHLAFPDMACDEQKFCEAMELQHGIRATHLAAPKELSPLHSIQLDPDEFFHPLRELTHLELRSIQTAGDRVVLSGIGSDELAQKTGYENAEVFANHEFADLIQFSKLNLNPRSWLNALQQCRYAFVPASILMALYDNGSYALRERYPWLTKNAVAMICNTRRDRFRALSNQTTTRWASAKLARAVRHEHDIAFMLKVCDRDCAQYGIEPRYPFLDINLVEYLFGIPHPIRTNIQNDKQLLIDSMNTDLPAMIRNRKKRTTFDSYISHILQNQWSALTKILTSGHLGSLNIIDLQSLKAWLLNFESCKLTGLANLLSLELWMARNLHEQG